MMRTELPLPVSFPVWVNLIKPYWVNLAKPRKSAECLQKVLRTKKRGGEEAREVVARQVVGHLWAAWALA